MSARKPSRRGRRDRSRRIALRAAGVIAALASGCTPASRTDRSGDGDGAVDPGSTGGLAPTSGGTSSSASGGFAATGTLGGAAASGGAPVGGGSGGLTAGGGTGGAGLGGGGANAGTGGASPTGGAAGTLGGSGGGGASPGSGASPGMGGLAGGLGAGGTGGVTSGGSAAGGGLAGSAASAGVAGAGGEGAGAAGGDGVAGSAAGGVPVVGVPSNPILPGLFADPQIAEFDGRFYVYPTTDGFDGWSSSSFQVFSSPDLVTWTDEGVILDLTRDVSWASSRAWAPGIARKNGVYYFYFSADTQIGVATSSSPTGPFEDALGRPLITAGQYGGQSIDPYVFTDDDGRSYLYFGNGSAGHVAELSDDMLSLLGTPQDLPVEGFREGSVAFKRNGIYYFMWSEDDTRSENYDVAYGTSASPLGPFTKAAVNPILKKDPAQGILATGHNSVLALPNGDYYIAYHRFAIPGGDGTHREVCLDRLTFNEDGTIVPVVPTL
jgi:GH43 family beta-xylosidase